MNRSAVLRWRSHLAMVLTFTLIATTMTLLGTSSARAATPITFSGTELLGIPTDTSIAINVVPDSNVTITYDYGTTSGVYTQSTTPSAALASTAHETVISGLNPNTRYFYRMRYQVSGESDWTSRAEHSFHTARSSGEEFVFTITTDSHLGMMGSAAVYEATTLNIEGDQPDLHFDLGDTVITNGETNQAGVDSAYLAQRPYMGNYGHSTPLFVTPGNHENEEGWNFDDTPFSLALGSIEGRKAFIPTPSPAAGGFYTTDTSTNPNIGGDGYTEAYYAWEWGDALFVVINPFHATMTNPYGTTAGEGGDDPASGDQWNWTLGDAQYWWLRSTLENSDAPFKFVFSHHVTGGQLVTGGSAGAPEYVRGGAAAADYFEWGGYDETDTYVFDTMRPGWGKPIHQLFVDEGVTAYYHGHDHQYAHEITDGVVYQEVPSASMTGSGFNLYSETDPETITVLPNSGHIRVTVNPSTGIATSEYVRSDTIPGSNGVISDTYTMAADEPETPGWLYRVNTGAGTIDMGAEPDFLGLTSGTPDAIPGLTISGDFAAEVTVTDTIDMGGVDPGLPMELFQSLMRTSATSGDVINFDFDVPDGDYEVRLHWAEHNSSIGAGQRLFDVALEGTTVLNDYDIFVESGGEDTAVTESLPVTVDDGTLNLSITQQTSVAIIRGIEILEGAGPDETPPVITLNGAAEMWVELDDTFVDPGATAYDNVDGSVAVVVGGDTVDTSTLDDYTITYNAVDSAGNPAIQVTRIVHVVEAVDVIYRVNAGGDTLTATAGPDFTGVTGDGTSGGITVSGTTSNSTTNAVDLSGVSLDLSPADAASLFQSTLYTTDAMSFAFGVGNGNYTVKLHLIEQQSSFGVGDRVFDVAFEGAVLLDDFDVFAAVGGTMVAHTETVPVTVADGELNIDFTNIESYANIRGIEVLSSDAVDETPPVITLNGAAEMWVEQDTVFTDPGATAYDNVDGSVPVVVGGDAVDTAVIDDYVITYDAVDAAGNPAVQATRTVHVIAPTGIVYRVNAGGDTLPSTYGPEFVGIGGDGTSGGITVSGTATNSTSETVDLSGVSLDLVSADAEDLFQTTLYSETDMSWAFDVDNGTYEVKLHLIEQQADFVAGDRVVDISLEGTLRLDNLDVYVASGGTMVAHTETVGVNVTDGELNIDFSSVVSYPNIRGIEITEIEDDEAPVITLIGDDPLTHEAGDPFTDPGATVTDNVDPTTTITGVSTVDADTPGDYTITYNHTDVAGNAATEVVRDVEVVDTTTPVITLVGANPMYVLQGATFTDPGATATDIVDGDLTGYIVVGGDTVITATIGDYLITYNVSDTAGNAATEVTRTVTVTEDLPPEITLLGDNPQVIEVGSAYVEAGATATDYEDGDLTSSIIIDASAVDTSQVGDYPVEYSVIDSFSNETIVTRTVEVVDTTAPVITLLGDNPLTHDVGDPFTDPGATVTDNVDPTTTISGVSTVDPNVVGSYTITYDYTDAAGNAATTVVRNVSVEDTAPPPSFTDDDGSIFEDDIEWLADMEITKGCNPPVNDMFCPNDPTTRGQMAAFFHRALGTLITINPDDVLTFKDTTGSVFANDIEWLSATGITKGCNPPINDMYCPNDLVTRGQMAAFVRRAFGDMIPAPASSGITFTDTGNSVFAADIQWLADTGITKGCAADKFCPEANVTRGEMAAFFRRAFTAAGLS